MVDRVAPVLQLGPPTGTRWSSRVFILVVSRSHQFYGSVAMMMMSEVHNKIQKK